MAELLIPEIDVTSLTSLARKVLRAAVFHAFENKEATRHVIPLEVFCRLAGLPTMSENEIAPLLLNAGKALGIIELVNTELSGNEDVPFVSWQLLQNAEVNAGNVIFRLYQYTYKEVIRTVLLSALADSKPFVDET